MPNTNIPSEHYPFATQDGKAIPLDILKPSGLIPVPFTEGAPVEITLPDTTGTAVRYNGYYPEAQEPSFLNMAGQKGIFRAGIRLGFWDSLGSVQARWSSPREY